MSRISSFASLASSGQLASSAGSYSSYGASPLDALLGGGSSGSSSSSCIDMNSMMQLLGALAGGRSLPGEMDWFDADVVAQNQDYLAGNYIDPADIVVTVRSDGQRVLSLTDEQWALIQNAELNVYVDDGEGYIDLGLDNVLDFDGNDLLLGFDGTWMTVNGHLAAFYLDSAADGVTRGHIPAMLTTTKPVELPLAGEGGTSSQGETVTQLVYLEVVFDDANPDGAITGARPMYEDDTDTVAKGDIQIARGDTIEFLCDYYTYDGSFDSAYKLGEPLRVNGDLEIVYYELANARCSVTYRLTDIYGNHFWTPAWEY